MFLSKQKLCWFIIALIMVLPGSMGLAQGGYPEPADRYVNDFAGLLTASNTAAIQDMLTQLDTEANIEAVVVTVDSIADYPTGAETVETFATGLFNTWGIGDKIQNDGILILVAVEERTVRIEVGSGYGDTLDAPMQEVINENMLPYFKAGDYNSGIYNGVRAVIHTITNEWVDDTPPSVEIIPPSSAPQSRNSESPGVSPPPIVLGGGALAVLGLAGVGWRRLTRYHNRCCPNCHTRMIRLDEAADDVYLDSGQKMEEMLQSVDYDVWKCPACDYHTLQGYGGWFKRHKSCPKCHYQTLLVTHERVVEPTYTHGGKERITRNCQNCHYNDKQMVYLPMLTRSDDSSGGSWGGSSSGGSSFGGGSSSGGGASGNW